MVKSDCEDAEKAREIEKRLASKTVASSLVNRSFHRKGKLVTFDRFLGEYWPHFNQAITKRFRTFFLLLCFWRDTEHMHQIHHWSSMRLWVSGTNSQRLSLLIVLIRSLGVILGSEETIETEKGHLSRNSYENISHRIQPAFAEHRALLYDTFLSYLAVKERLDDFDASER